MSENGRLWEDSALSIAAPPSLSTWAAWSFSGALGASYQFVRLLLAGNLAGAAERTLSIEVDNATLTLDGSATPSVLLGAENANTYQLDFRIRNAATAEMFSLDFPIKLGQSVCIDCENKTALSLESKGNIFGALDIPVQSEWLTLKPGQNTLVFSEDGLVDVGIEIAWHERDGGI